MKIDIHTHTKKVKSGDSPKRTVSVERFADIIRSVDVRILAITNHNHFDMVQYREFRESVADVCQIWPGIEFDVIGSGGKRAHLLVIASPINVESFSQRTSKVLSGRNPDSFTITLQGIIDNFDDLDCLYIAHYYAKKPDLSDEDVEFLINNVSNPKRILKEATNSISVGIYISHGHNSIFGSDIHDWDDYMSVSKSLPELRLPVESFEQFCLLLEKDDATINTLLNKKTKETITLNPFGIAESFDLDIYNDINILFGSKGTGKTDILKALSVYYNNKGYKTHVYESSTQHINSVYDLKCANLVLDLPRYGLDDCQEEFLEIKAAEDREVTALARYFQHFSIAETNKIAQKISIKSYTLEDDRHPKRQLKLVNEVVKLFVAFRNNINESKALEEIVGKELVEALMSVLSQIITKLKEESESRILDANAVKLFNSLIKFFNAEIAKKTGLPEKPVTTGFSEYADNRLRIEKSIKKILFNIHKEIDSETVSVGSLGEKGELHCQTSIIIQDGSKPVVDFSSAKKNIKNIQKQVVSSLLSIAKHVYTVELFEKIAHLNGIEGHENIASVSDLVLYRRQFLLQNQPYHPSNGESSMILLHNELKEDRDIYLIDEPEKSLGNDYINDVIVPLLKDRALMGKKVIIATHDANIAVRTLPYNSVYRMHDAKGYYTYTGNPFSNNLKCKQTRPDIDWKEISMKTLEGGRNAFGERGKIYGNI